MALAPGDVVRIPVAFKNGESKYLVIADLDTKAHCLVINSRIHTLYGGGLGRDSIVEIDVQTHPFMRHDSHIDCNEIKRLPLEHVQREINSNADCLKGSISDELRNAITNAIRVSPFLSPNQKSRYVASLNDI